MGRIAPRSLRLTDSTRAVGSDAFNQSTSVVPRKRRGEAPGPVVPSSGASESWTLSKLRMIPVCAGHRPERIAECPGAFGDPLRPVARTHGDHPQLGECPGLARAAAGHDRPGRFAAALPRYHAGRLVESVRSNGAR